MKIDRTNEIAETLEAWNTLPDFQELVTVMNDLINNIVDSYRDPRQHTPQIHLKPLEDEKQ